MSSKDIRSNGNECLAHKSGIATNDQPRVLWILAGDIARNPCYSTPDIHYCEIFGDDCPTS